MPTTTVSGPGRRFALGPTRRAQQTGVVGAGELPAAYGTRQLWLTARDPHWLYAHWDLSPEEMDVLEGRAAAGHLGLRVHENAVGPGAVVEVPLARGARSWFVHVGRAGVRYVAELGYVASEVGWQTILTSNGVTAPRAAAEVEAGERVQFATIPIDVPFGVVVEKVAQAARRDEPLAQALDALRAQGFVDLPAPAAARDPVWTPTHERALAEVLRVDEERRVWVSSLDVTGLVARGLEAGAGVPEGGLSEQPSSPSSGFAGGEVGGMSSPAGAQGSGERPRGFWFNVNAELVVYGATEPDAQVTIAGKAVRLRPDGSFSLRFALPDGDYDLRVVARAKSGDDGRSADLEFRRHTQYQGAVGEHPQDARLGPPRAESITAVGVAVPG